MSSSEKSYFWYFFTDSTSFCQPGICQHGGQCLEGVSSYICDCNMTTYVGDVCTEGKSTSLLVYITFLSVLHLISPSYMYLGLFVFCTEAEGYRYNGSGIVTLFFRPPIDTDEDRLAFGFMTWNENGTFTRLDSDSGADFLEAKLVTVGSLVTIFYPGERFTKS